MAASGLSVYWRLSNLYLWFFAALGVLIPYWALYLADQGFRYMEIALLMATLQGTKILAPNIWGWLGDRSGRRLRLMRLGAMMALLCFACVLLRPGFWGLLLIMVAFSFFWNAVLPLFEVITLHNLGADARRYGRVRLWGSIGFIASVAAVGAALEWLPVALLPWLILPLFMGLFLASLGVTDEPGTRREAHHGPVMAIVKKPEVWSFFVLNFMLQASHGPYYAFFSIHLEGLGYARSSIGAVWALGVIAEVALFVVMHRVLAAFPMRSIMLVAAGLTALRWALIAEFSALVWVLLLAQLFHAASYAALHAASIHYIHAHFGAGHQGQGQALYSGLSFGAGGATGAAVAGVMVEWDSTGAAFEMSVLAMLIGLAVAWVWMRPAPERALAGARPD